MAELSTYEGPAEVYINGRLLAEATRISVRNVSGNSRVVTMHKGMAGWSDGPRTSEITVENAVPKAGLELDFVDYLVAGRAVKIVQRTQGKRREYRGYIDETTEENAVETAASISFSFVGGPPKIVG